jgi:hypothetical protein
MKKATNNAMITKNIGDQALPWLTLFVMKLLSTVAAVAGDACRGYGLQ